MIVQEAFEDAERAEILKKMRDEPYTAENLRVHIANLEHATGDLQDRLAASEAQLATSKEETAFARKMCQDWGQSWNEQVNQNVALRAQLAASEAEVARLRDKYDLQLLVQREEALRVQLNASEAMRKADWEVAQRLEARVKELETDVQHALLNRYRLENRELIAALLEQKAENARLRVALRLCGAQAGASDPSLACRLIIRTVAVGLEVSSNERSKE